MLAYKRYMKSDLHEWVVFVHGIGGSSTIFAKQFKRYKQDFNVLLVDLRGHGKTGPLVHKGPYTLPMLSEDILSIMDHIGIKRAHFVGVSLGTILIRQLMILAPERIIRVVMAGAITTYTLRIKWWLWVGTRLKHILPYMWLYRFFAWILMPKRSHRFSRTMFIREAKRMNQREFLRWFDLVHEVEPLFRAFTRTSTPIPTLYLMGEEDYMFRSKVEQDTAGDPHVRFVALASSGHVCNVDQSDRFNQESIQFFQQKNN